MQPWDPWGLGSRPCLLILVPAIPWYFSFSKREGDFHKQIPSQWALFWPSSSVGPLLVFGCLFQSVFLDLHLHRYLLSPPSHSGIYHLEVWEEIFHIHVLPALRHIHSSVSIWSLTTEEHRPLPRWLQGPMPGSWVSLQLLQQPRVYTHKNNLSGQVCLLLQLKKLNLQLCCKRVWKNLSRPAEKLKKKNKNSITVSVGALRSCGNGEGHFCSVWRWWHGNIPTWSQQEVQCYLRMQYKEHKLAFSNCLHHAEPYHAIGLLC